MTQAALRSPLPLLPAPQRVLVKEVNWLGDLVMSLPALHAVRRAFPDARLSVLVKAELASFFDGAGWIDEVIPYRVGRSLGGLADRRHVVAEIRSRALRPRDPLSAQLRGGASGPRWRAYRGASASPPTGAA